MTVSNCLIEMFINHCLIALGDPIDSFVGEYRVILDRDLYPLLFGLADSTDSIFPKGGKLVEDIVESLSLLWCGTIIGVDVNCICVKLPWVVMVRRRG